MHLAIGLLALGVCVYATTALVARPRRSKDAVKTFAMEPGRGRRDLLDVLRRIWGAYIKVAGTDTPSSSRESSPIRNLLRPAKKLLYTKEEVESSFAPNSWQRVAYDEFKAVITAKNERKAFPCVYATMGYRQGDHRYVFCESYDPSEPRNLRIVAPALRDYIEEARSLGPNTSLVIMCGPMPKRKLSVVDYNENFWAMLRGLREEDQKAWPTDIPTSLHDAKWTFCFDGVPLFPVSLTPSHNARFSRHSSVPLIALQPKWILDELLATPEKREAAQNKVRKLLVDYDQPLEVSPELQAYGTAGTTEANQLCLLDENERATLPFDNLDR